jgi:iron(III) transport system permease protein
MALWAPFIKYWPYNLDFTLDNFAFADFDASGWSPYWVSIKMASGVAVLGTIVVFLGAYIVEKGRGFAWGRGIAHLLAMVPLAVPGLVLGLGYIFFFNAPGNPLNFIYGTLAILVVSTVAHFYTVAHLTAVTALKQIDGEFEAVSASLKVPFYVTLKRVTVPICLPAILDIAIYLFVNAMTTVSAVVFLYGPNTALASVAVLNMDDAGDIAPAAAMGMMIFYTAASVRGLHFLVAWWLEKRTQAWRRR